VIIRRRRQVRRSDGQRCSRLRDRTRRQHAARRLPGIPKAGPSPAAERATLSGRCRESRARGTIRRTVRPRLRTAPFRAEWITPPTVRRPRHQRRIRRGTSGRTSAAHHANSRRRRVATIALQAAASRRRGRQSAPRPRRHGRPAATGRHLAHRAAARPVQPDRAAAAGGKGGRLAIGDCRLPIHGLSIGDCRLTDWRLQTADWRSRIADCRLSIVDCRLQIGDWRLPIADCRLPIADCRLPIGAVTSWRRNHNRQSQSPITIDNHPIVNHPIVNPLIDNP
jgi:hypothetical protein